MILSQLRARVEAVIFDGGGAAAYVIDVGRFTRISPDRFDGDASAERRVRIAFGPAVDLDGVRNSLDGHALTQRALQVTVEYARTGGGSDLAEGYSEQGGGGTDDVLLDRMAHDQHAITRALAWHENWSSLEPHVFLIAQDGAPEYALDDPEVATMTMTFVVSSREQTLTSFSL